MEIAETSVDQNHFRFILSKIIHEKLDYQSMPATILVALREIIGFLQSIVDQLEKSGHSMQVACGSGCSYCCHSQINVIPVEALLIFSFIEKSFDRSACESAFVSGNHNAEIEVFEGRNYMYSAARDVFQNLSVQLEIETGIYKMSDAILNCFSMSTPLVNWLAGESVFNRG